MKHDSDFHDDLSETHGSWINSNSAARQLLHLHGGLLEDLQGHLVTLQGLHPKLHLEWEMGRSLISDLAMSPWIFGQCKFQKKWLRL